MRGKPDAGRAALYDKRITPAHAGKTAGRYVRHSFVRDHPRACGENKAAAKKQGCCPGSPPRMRGKLEAIPQIIDGIRITPAHAGKTIVKASAMLIKQDHPRACGENDYDGVGGPEALGSPPRMRGKL